MDINDVAVSSDQLLAGTGSDSTSDRQEEMTLPSESTSTSSVAKVSDRKRKKYLCVYKRDYSERFPWAAESKKGKTFAYCMPCGRDVCLGQGGTKDLAKHEQTNLHLKSQQGFSGIRPLHSYLGPVRKESVIMAEIKFGYFLGEHHLPLLLADHCGRLFRSMFPDSSIAKDFKCGHTKATAILKIISQEIHRQQLSSMNDSLFFSVQTDETTDITVTQQSALMLRYFDNTMGKVKCVFHALENVKAADACHLFEAIDKHFGDSPIVYDRLVGLGTDGCNVMMGVRNSVLSRLQSKQPALVAFHCNCHIAALIPNHACKVMPKELEELTSDVWYYFHRSAKRIRMFEQFQQFVETKPHKLLKSSQTRWLSLEACVNRLIEQYDALLSYFRSTEEDSATVRRISAVLEKPLTKAYLLFLSNALPVINYFNKCMQQEAPLLHIFIEEVESLVRKLLLRFMDASYIGSLPALSGVCIDNEEKYLPLDEVFVGHSTLSYLEQALNDSISTGELRSFRETVRNWWYISSKEALKRLPLQDKFLMSLKWLQPGQNQYTLMNQVLEVAKHLPQVIKTDDLSTLQEEFMDFCTSPLSPKLNNVKEVDRY